ncbi:SGNH/GDSL hydrolase family protein [uncultured Tateyamaria sp.]|uniref:SGNH/GDSL hydrolase family protein n=1 Tax=uncultured Tateyamaria sp. TaxID=455651 RepID=UPI00262CE8E8|nr:SGNH/GDSL hydrolase family protein [uncultured Tateyamaria sp.]
MAPRTILCFGDSNTHGTLAMRHMGDRRRLARAERWPSVMGAALGPDWEVIAEGHPGRTTVFEDPIEGEHKSGLRTLPALLETHRPIDLVLLMLGTNDLKARFGLTAFDIALGVQRLALDVRRSDSGPDGAPPQVMLVAPVKAVEAGCLAPIFTGCAETSAALPAHLSQIATAHGFGFADANAVARVDPVDGIHLSAESHAAIGAHLAQAVTDFMP